MNTAAAAAATAMAAVQRARAALSPGSMAWLMAPPTRAGTLTRATVHSNPTTTPKTTPVHWWRRVPPMSFQPSRVVETLVVSLMALLLPPCGGVNLPGRPPVAETGSAQFTSAGASSRQASIATVASSAGSTCTHT